MWLAIIILAIIIIAVLWAVGTYNRLVELRNQVKNSWSQIDVQLRRRYDLIPNLVETVKGYMKHERGTLEAVIEARNQAKQAREEINRLGGPTEEGSLTQLIGAEGALRGALGNIFALAESYPDLKANQTMQRLQEELSSTENKVAFSRQAYNDQVMVYNTAQEVFPTNLVAGPFGHHKAELFQVEESQVREAPKVTFP
jgi:LemA protein